MLKNKPLLWAVTGLLLLIVGLNNSCQKNDENVSVTNFLATDNPWRLASLRVDTVSGDVTTRDTLNTNCAFTQTFKFNKDGTCTYANYSCLNNVAQGRWTYNAERLVLNSDMVCKDTSAAGVAKPFEYARIINLGQNVLNMETTETIDTIRKVPLTLRLKVTNYGFIH